MNRRLTANSGSTSSPCRRALVSSLAIWIDGSKPIPLSRLGKVTIQMKTTSMIHWANDVSSAWPFPSNSKWRAGLPIRLAALGAMATVTSAPTRLNPSRGIVVRRGRDVAYEHRQANGNVKLSTVIALSGFSIKPSSRGS
jgi:hypothetical protein